MPPVGRLWPSDYDEGDDADDAGEDDAYDDDYHGIDDAGDDGDGVLNQSSCCRGQMMEQVR